MIPLHESSNHTQAGYHIKMAVSFFIQKANSNQKYTPPWIFQTLKA